MDSSKEVQAATLTKKFFIEGTIEALTGLHIGGSNVGLSIGGVDATVVRNPLDNKPYIPGSSLKGKMRSLLERMEGKINDQANMGVVKFGPYVNLQDRTTLIPRIFGVAPNERDNSKEEAIKEPISRLIVRDCRLTDDSFTRLNNMQASDMPYTEVKTEVVIDRINSRAMPRQLERVPAGATFHMRIILNVFQMDGDGLPHLQKVLQSLCLVQDDYLGGKGTRGSGEIAVKVTRILEKTRADYETGGDGSDITGSITIPNALR